MLGLYENFPPTIHLQETYTSALSKQKLQLKFAQVLRDINSRSFTFEETSNPAMPNCTVIFMFGVADTDGFKFFNDAQVKRLVQAVADGRERIDFFCAVRYYKNTQPKRTPLKFDYYLLRLVFGEDGSVQFVVSHERGPRYLSPEDFAGFIAQSVNGKGKKKTLQHNTAD